MHERAALRQVAETWMEQVWRERQLEAVATLHAPDFVDHTPGEREPDNAGFVAGLEQFYQVFPDWSAWIDDLVIDTETGQVALRWSATATQQGAYLGCPATGRQIQFNGIEILRIAAGRIYERWGEWDGLSLLSQLRGA